MTLDDLSAFGANVNEGMTRCLNNEGFYLQMVESIKEETGFDALRDAINAGDLNEHLRLRTLSKESWPTLPSRPCTSLRARLPSCCAPSKMPTIPPS